MGLTLKQIETVLEVAKKHNVYKFEFEGLRVVFKHKPINSTDTVSKITINTNTGTASVNDPVGGKSGLLPPSIEDVNLYSANMTEEELKYYATPYYDELQAMKEDEKLKKLGAKP